MVRFRTGLARRCVCTTRMGPCKRSTQDLLVNNMQHWRVNISSPRPAPSSGSECLRVYPCQSAYPGRRAGSADPTAREVVVAGLLVVDEPMSWRCHARKVFPASCAVSMARVRKSRRLPPTLGRRHRLCRVREISVPQPAGAVHTQTDMCVRKPALQVVRKTRVSVTPTRWTPSASGSPAPRATRASSASRFVYDQRTWHGEAASFSKASGPD